MKKSLWRVAYREYTNWEIYFDDYDDSFTMAKKLYSKTISDILQLHENDYW